MLATPLGLALGACRQLRTAAKDSRFPQTEFFKIAVPCTFLIVLTAFIVIPSVWSQRSAVHRLRGMQPNGINRVSVYDQNTDRLLGRIDDKKILAEFAAGCSDVTAYDAGKNRRLQEWRVVLAEDDIELECDYVENWNDVVVGEVVQKNSDTKRSLGGFKSVLLRCWFDEYVMPLASK